MQDSNPSQAEHTGESESCLVCLESIGKLLGH